MIAMTAKDKARKERLAAALRENLKRRKAQSRKLDDDPISDDSPSPSRR